MPNSVHQIQAAGCSENEQRLIALGLRPMRRDLGCGESGQVISDRMPGRVVFHVDVLVRREARIPIKEPGGDLEEA